MKLAVDSRSSLPLKLLRKRRLEAKDKDRFREKGGQAKVVAGLPVLEEPEAFGYVDLKWGRHELIRSFDVDPQDLKDLFILSK
jgi:hypothetical protein